MKLIALTAAGVLALGGISAVQAHGPGDHNGRGHRKMMFKMDGERLEKLTRTLDLTEAQQAQIKPVIEQAKPQIEAIHREAMEKAKTVMENTHSQIRALLTPEQQAKFDKMKAAREKMREARKEMREARQQ